MKRKNMTRNALFTSIISLLLCVSMLVGTTFAWFTDEVVTGMNTIAAGNLDIELLADGTKVDSNTMLFDDVKLWEPGVVVYENLQIANVGTLALKYQMSLNFGGENDLNGHKLSEVLKVAIIDKVADGTSRETVLAAAKAVGGTLSAFTMTGELEANTSTDEKAVVIFWDPNENSVDNLYNVNNGKSTSDGEPLHIKFGVNLQATQKMSEEDSFGNDYDESAPNLPESATEVTNSEELKTAIENGETNIKLADGTYQMPAVAQGKTLTISGSKNAVIEVVPGGGGEAGGQLDYSLDGSTVTFNGVTIKTNSQTYAGYARLSATYNNCVIQNTYNLGVGNSTFNNCTINITNEYLRVGGAYKAVFDGCTFNTDGRAILVFQDGTQNAQTVTVKDCTFNATAAANTWNGIHVAAVSCDGSQGGTYVVNLEGNNVVDSDFNGLWQIKAGEDNITINEQSDPNLPESGNGVTTAEELKAALANGEKEIQIKGSITLTESLGASDVTLTGAGAGAGINFNGCNIGGSGTITYKNLNLSTVALPYAPENGERYGWYGGIDYNGHNVANYEDCTITGVFTTYSKTVNATRCTFNSYVQDGEEYYNIFLYGGGTVNANGCTFMYRDRAVKIYSEGANNFVLNITGGKFLATSDYTVNKALINVDSTYFASAVINVDGVEIDTKLAGAALHNAEGNAKVTVTVK